MIRSILTVVASVGMFALCAFLGAESLSWALTGPDTSSTMATLIWCCGATLPIMALMAALVGVGLLAGPDGVTGGLKPVRAGVYMYTAPWVESENRYHPIRRDRANTLVSKTFWTVKAARRWAEKTHLKYLAGEPCLTVTTVAFVAYGDWEDLQPAVPYYAFPENFGTNDSVWLRQDDPYATVWAL